MATDSPSSFDIPTLEQMYMDSCKSHGVLANPAILTSFFKARVKKSCNELCCLEIFLDQFKDVDFPPLLDLCKAIGASEIEAIDVHNGVSCVLNGEYALALMRAFDQKLRLVDLQDSSFGKDFLRELSHKGLTCQVINLRSSHFRKLNMAGEFLRLRTLNLDFSPLLTTFHEDCFSCMPNLICLSMCETRVSNLWTTTAALSKLPSLVELRFQKWLCCNDSGSSPSVAHSGKLSEESDFNSLEQRDLNIGTDAPRNMFPFSNMAMNRELQSLMDYSSDDSEVDFSSQQQEFDYFDLLSNASPAWIQQINLQNAVFLDASWNYDEEFEENESADHAADVALKYISCHASPICLEKHYREFMIASLPQLKVLDNLPIRKIDKDRAAVTFSKYFECLPYKRKLKESVVSVLHRREIKESLSLHSSRNRRPSYSRQNSQYLYTRSLGSAKVGSSAWPLLQSLAISGSDVWDGNRNFRPRQFEYHPSVSNLMVFGTLDGEVVVINHENGKMVSYVPSIGAANSVLGLCWLKKYPSKLIAGSDNGSLKMYNIEHALSTSGSTQSRPTSVTFDDFDQLTSVHANACDELFLASGYSKNIALYDINSGKRVQMFTDMHKEHINVVKFSNHSPFTFATSSFDRDVKLWDLRQSPVRPCYTSSSSKGNVMVCFSPDDHHLLVSAVDNEVRQLLAVDGRLHMNFEIPSTGSSQNYTRSYYMNGRDYIISGSCDEHVVRVCCAQTGMRLRDVSLEGKGFGFSMYVQSLRGDPFNDFNMSVLAAYMRPNSKSDIVKVNLLASSHSMKEYEPGHHDCRSNSMGG